MLFIWGLPTPRASEVDVWHIPMVLLSENPLFADTEAMNPLVRVELRHGNRVIDNPTLRVKMTKRTNIRLHNMAHIRIKLHADLVDGAEVICYDGRDQVIRRCVLPSLVPVIRGRYRAYSCYNQEVDLPPRFSAHDCLLDGPAQHIVVHMGDSFYLDADFYRAVQRNSATADDVCRIWLKSIHRTPGLIRCYMTRYNVIMYDDHEIVNNFQTHMQHNELNPSVRGMIDAFWTVAHAMFDLDGSDIECGSDVRYHRIRSNCVAMFVVLDDKLSSDRWASALDECRFDPNAIDNVLYLFTGKAPILETNLIPCCGHGREDPEYIQVQARALADFSHRTKARVIWCGGDIHQGILPVETNPMLTVCVTSNLRGLPDLHHGARIV